MDIAAPARWRRMPRVGGDECERTGGQLGWSSGAATTNQRDVQHQSATTWRNVMYIGFPIIGLALVFVLLYFAVNSRRDTSPTRR
jgi:hypothetical protein